MQIHRADVRTDHIDIVEMGMGPILKHPRAPAWITDVGHRHCLARPIDHLRPAKGERADGLWVFAVRTADRAEVSDVLGPEDGVEGVDPVSEQLHPSVVDIVRGARSLSAPHVVLRGLVHDLTLRRQDE